MTLVSETSMKLISLISSGQESGDSMIWIKMQKLALKTIQTDDLRHWRSLGSRCSNYFCCSGEAMKLVWIYLEETFATKPSPELLVPGTGLSRQVLLEHEPFDPATSRL